MIENDEAIDNLDRAAPRVSFDTEQVPHDLESEPNSFYESSDSTEGEIPLETDQADATADAVVIENEHIGLDGIEEMTVEGNALESEADQEKDGARNIFYVRAYRRLLCIR